MYPRRRQYKRGSANSISVKFLAAVGLARSGKGIMMTADQWFALPFSQQVKIKRAWMDHHNERSRVHRAKRKDEMQMQPRRKDSDSKKRGTE